MTRIVVTLDGPAGVGKTTLAKWVARDLCIAYLDTGAMFRATAWKLGEGAWDLPEAEIEARMRDFVFTLSGVGEESTLALDGVPLTDEIRTETVGMWASNIATVPAVRAFQKTAQQKIGRAISLTAEGRDMGTVIFPDAPCKIFLDATPEVRALRRHKQLVAMGKESPGVEALIVQIKARDDQDRNRPIAPLKPADDAVLIDTTHLDKEGVFAAIKAALRAKGIGG